MDAKITRTRVIIPQRRPDQLSRPRVLKRLFDLNKHKLLIVVAPPGYGKTSLLIDFAGKIEQPVCWYAIDSLDENPSRFFSHLVASIAQVHEGFGRECRMALQEQLANNGALVDLVPTIVNELYDHTDKRFTIVLDDFHLVQENGEIQDFLNVFIQQVEDSCQIVISSRRLIRLPDLPLMVARSLVGGISIEDLCFQTDEIQALIAQNFGEAIDEDMALELIDKTEGWITGLLLSTQLTKESSLGGGSLGGGSLGSSALQRATGVDLYHYLAQQVFLQQEPEIQTFLLRTSLLDEFNEAFCQQIFVPEIYPEETDWQSLMDAVVANNLFILPVGDGKPWFRYHNLFQEFLSRRAHAERPQEANQLLDQLAEHHIQSQAWEQAYQVRKQQGNVEALADMIEMALPALMQECQLPLCKKWLADLPEDVLHERPMLLAFKGYANVSSGLTDGMKQLTNAIGKLALSSPTLNYAIALTWRAEFHRMMGKYDLSLDDANTTLSVLEQLNDGALKNGSTQLSLRIADALHIKGIVCYMIGETFEGSKHLEKAVHTYEVHRANSMGAVVLVNWATVNMHSGNYEEAKNQFQKALDYTSIHSRQQPRVQILNNLGWLHHMGGEYVKAHELLCQALDLARQMEHTYLQTLCLTSLGELWIDVRAVEAAQLCYQEAALLIKRLDSPYLLLHIEIARAQLACMAEDWSAAFDCLDRTGRTILANPQQPGWHTYKITMGQFYLQRKNNRQATAMFREALDGLANSGQRIEEAQTRLLLAGAAYRIGEIALVQEQIEETAKIIGELLIWQPLIVKGRLVIDMLEHIAQSYVGTDDEHIVQFSTDLLSRIKHFDKNLDAIRTNLTNLRSEQVEAESKTGRDYELIIRTLGRTEIIHSGKQVQNWQGKSNIARDLFFCLVAHKEGLTKEEIGTLFWPDAAPAELKARFKNAVYRVRKAISPDVILFEADLYKLNPDIDFFCDADAFEAAIATARSANTSLHEKEALLQALSLYTGGYLIEIEAMWSWLERERLSHLYVEASARLAELHLDYGENSEALQLSQSLLNDDPCLEEAHRLIMRIHGAVGNRAALVRQFELCEQSLHDEFGALPSEQTRSLFVVLTS